MGTFTTFDYTHIFISFTFTNMIFVLNLNGFLQEVDIGISKYGNFESRQFQSISATLSDWGSLGLPQSETSD